MDESRERDRQRRLEYERKQAEAAEAERVKAERQAALARYQANEKLKAELAERNRRQAHDQTLTGLLDHAIRQEQFRHGVVRSAGFARASAEIDAAFALLNPPPPSPEPESEIDPDPIGSYLDGASTDKPARRSKIKPGSALRLPKSGVFQMTAGECRLISLAGK